MLGGVEAIIGAHARLLRERGHEVTVLAGRGDCEVVPELDSRHPEVEGIYLALGRGEKVTAGFEALRGRLREKLRSLLAGDPLVIAHNVLTMPFNLPLAAALRDQSAVRLVAWTHDLAWTNPRYAGFHREGFPYELLHTFTPGTLPVAISEMRRREIVTTYEINPERVPVVPNGIDLDALLHIRAGTRALLESAGLSGPGPLLLVPVRVTRRKRLELAIEATALLRESQPGVRLVITGPLGPHSADNLGYSAELLQLRRRLGLEGAVVFMHELADPHPVDEEMIAEFYRLASAIVLPSESEGFGIPVLEAGVNRVPVVCTDLAVFREAAGEDAWTFPAAAGAGAVAAAISAALATSQARLQHRVRTDYGWPALTDRLEEVIRLAG